MINIPIYEYKCKLCNKVIEKIQKISDIPLTICEECGGELTRLISKSSFKLIGSGFYVNDYSSEKGKDENR